MPDFPSVANFLASRKKKLQSDYKKSIEDGETPLVTPSAEPDLKPVQSVGDFMAKRYAKPEATIGMGDFRMATGEGQDNPPLPVSPELSKYQQFKERQADTYEVKNENKVYDSKPLFDEPKPIGYQALTPQQAVEQTVAKDAGNQRVREQKAAQEWMKRRERALQQMKGNADNIKFVLPESIANMEILPADVANIPAESLPWDRLGQFAGLTDAANTGKTNPEQGKAMLLKVMEDRENSPARQMLRGFTHGAVEQLSLGIAQPIASSGSKVENVAQFAGSVVGQIPLVVGANAALPAKLANPILRGAATGAVLQTGREVAGAVARPEDFDAKQSAKNIASNALEYGAYMGVYSKLNPAIDNLIAKAPRLEKVMSNAAGEIVKGTATGAVAGGAVGVGKAAINALSESGFNVREFAKQIADESKQEMSEEFVEAIALGIVQRFAGGKVNVNAEMPVQQAPAPTTAAEAPKVETAVQPLDRVALLREKMPGADEGKLRADVETTKNLSDEEFRSFAERYGKPIETKVEDKPAGTVATTSVEPQKDSSTLSQTTKEVIPEPAVDVEGTPILSSQVQKPLKPTIPNSELKVGDTVKVANRTPVYEVVDTKDRSMVTVREVGKPDAPTFAVGRKAVAKNENKVYDSAPPTATTATKKTKTATPSKKVASSNNTSLDSQTIQEYNPGQNGQGVSEMVAPKSEEVTTNKEPWQMDEEEYAPAKPEWATRVPNAWTKSAQQAYAYERRAKQAEWYKSVEQAFIAGKPVPMRNRPVWSLTKAQEKQYYGNGEEEHRDSIKQAIAEGKPVPDEVLADYPDLQNTPPEPPPKGGQPKPEPSSTGGSSSLPTTAENENKVYDSAPEGYTQLRRNGNTAFTEKFAKAEAERMNAEGRAAVVIPDKNQPNLRNVYVASKTQAFSGGRPGMPNQQSQPIATVKRREIAKFLDKHFAPMKTGSVRGKGVLGLYNKVTQVIRTKVAEDFPIQLHEVGHFLDQKLGLANPFYDGELTALGQPTSPKGAAKAYLRDEGVGEFVRLYVSDPQTAQQKAPNYYVAFEQIMTANPDIHIPLLEARDMVMRWNSMDVEDRLDGVISVDDKDPHPPVTFERMYQRMFEEFESLKRFTNIMTGGKPVPIDEDPYSMARLLRGWTGKAHTFLRKGVVDDNYNVVSEPFEKILRDVDDVQAFRRYAVSKRSVEKMAQGFALEDTVGVGFRPGEVESVVKKYDAKYGPILQRLVTFQDHVLEEMVKSEVISADAKTAMRQMNQDYVPFYRWFEEGTNRFLTSTTQLGNTRNPIKEFKGSGRTIIDPIESMVKNTFMMLNVAQRNSIMVAFDKIATDQNNAIRASRVWVEEPTAMRAVDFNLESVAKDIKDTLQQQGITLPKGIDLDKLVTTFVPFAQPRGSNLQVSFRRNGETKIVAVDPELYRSLMALDTESANIITQVLSIPAGWLRQGAILNPDFLASNPLADQPTAFIQSNSGYIPFVDMMRGLFHAVKKTDLYWKWVASGGDQVGIATLDRKQVQIEMKELSEEAKRGKLGTLMYPIKHPILFLGSLSQYSDTATRLGENLRKVEKDVKSSGAMPQNRSLKDRVLGTDLAPYVTKRTQMEASLDARNVTTDFHQRGTWTRQFNPIKAFFGAQMTSNKNAVKAMVKYPARTAVKASIAFTLPTILLYLLNRENPYYDEKKEWQKDAFWFIPTDWSNGIESARRSKNFVWIPKKHIYSMTFAALPERLMRWIDQQDKHAFDGFAKRYWDTVWPGDIGGIVPLPTAVDPVLENATNHDFYTDLPIVPQREMRFEPEDRYDVYNSETAKKVGDLTNTSPRMIDNLISGYGGGLATTAQDAAEGIAKGVAKAGEKVGLWDAQSFNQAPDRGLADFPIARRFLRDQGGIGQGSSVDIFTDTLTKMEQAYASTPEKASEKKNMLKALRPWRADEEEMQAKRKEKRDILADEKMDPAEKRRRIDVLDAEITNIARERIGKPAIR